MSQDYDIQKKSHHCASRHSHSTTNRAESDERQHRSEATCERQLCHTRDEKINETPQNNAKTAAHLEAPK